MDARTAWTRAPAWARWVAAYLGALLLAALLAASTPLAAGEAAFILGAALILASVHFIGTGGPRSVVTARAPDGAVLRREPVPPDERRAQIRLGVGLFLTGLALWAPIAAQAFLH